MKRGKGRVEAKGRKWFDKWIALFLVFLVSYVLILLGWHGLVWPG